jgi:hypothetical protein
MKKVILLTGTFCIILAAANVNATTPKTAAVLIVMAGDFKKVKDGTWLGKDNTWYKIGDKKVWWSKDGKKWEESKEGMWQDKEGKWLRIGDNKLWWSKDGKEWSEVPEWKWEGEDGTWYKFDKDWSLWSMTAKK